MSTLFRGISIGALALGIGACEYESDSEQLRYITSGSAPTSYPYTTGDEPYTTGDEPYTTGDEPYTTGDEPYEPGPVCGYHTQTQGGWGTRCNGYNPACFRDEYFEAVFPKGLKIGCAANTVTFKNTLAIQKALPTGGKPRALVYDEIGTFDGYGDPALGTVLAGQVVALSLTVGFSELPEFVSPDLQSFRHLTIADPHSACHGMSVQAVLYAANAALGGCATDLSATEVNECATLINESFVDGEPDCSPVYAYPDHTGGSPTRPGDSFTVAEPVPQ